MDGVIFCNIRCEYFYRAKPWVFGRGKKMEKIVSCGFNMDTARVELRFADGRVVAIDTTAVGVRNI